MIKYIVKHFDEDLVLSVREQRFVDQVSIDPSVSKTIEKSYLKSRRQQGRWLLAAIPKWRLKRSL